MRSPVIASALLVLAACAADPVAPKPVAESVFAVTDRGAQVSFVEYEAESAAFRGTLIGPDRKARTLAGEASGRMAVTLAGEQDQVEFTLTRPANAITVRASVPDGTETTLRVLVDSAVVKELPVTSKYSWFYGGYPFGNDPAAGLGHHFYDHSRALLGRDLPAGTKVAVKCGCTVDYADFEQVAAPLPQPSGSVSIVDLGADPSGAKDSTAAIQQALNKHQVVWIPAGTFKVTGHLIADKVELLGAGIWHSILTGDGVGVYGRQSTDVRLADFAIIGEVTKRDDGAQVNGVGGALGGGSVVERLFIQHTKVGLWLDGPFDGLTVRGNRIMDTTADGLNLHQGISNTVVEDNLIRNTGDDGLAMWSDQNPNHHNIFRRNTIQFPILANGIGIYGGHDNQAVGNVIADIVIEGAGIQIANRFSGTVALSGATTLADNTILRGGSRFAGIQADVGAIFLFGKDSALTGTVKLTGNTVVDSSYSGLHLYGSNVADVQIDGLTVLRPGTVGVQIQSMGQAVVTRSEVDGGVYLCPDGLPFTLTVTESKGLEKPECKGI